MKENLLMLNLLIHAEMWKLSYSFFWDDNWNRYYNHGFRLAPDGLKNHYRTNTIKQFKFSYYPVTRSFFHTKI